MKKLLVTLTLAFPLLMQAQPNVGTTDISPMKHYLFAYFNDNTTEGQQVCYAVSDDGVHFTPLNNGQHVIGSDTISRSGGVRDANLLQNE